MAYRFNPAPGWPEPPAGWSPPEGWQPDPAWPPAPEGWEFWVWEEESLVSSTDPEPEQPGLPPQADPLAEQQHEAPEVREAQVDPVMHGDPEAAEAAEEVAVPQVPEPEATAEPQEQSPAGWGAQPVVPPQADPLAEQQQEAPEVREAQVDPVMHGDPEAAEQPPPPEQPVQPQEQSPAGWGAQPAQQQPWAPEAAPQEPTAMPEQAPAEAGWTQGEQATGQWGAESQHQPQWGHPHQAHQHPSTGQAHPAHTGQQYAHQPVQQPQQPMYQSQPPPSRPKKKGKGLLIVLIVLALVLAVAFVWALMQSLSGSSNASTPQPAMTQDAEESPVAPGVEETPEENGIDVDGEEPAEIVDADLEEADVPDLDTLAAEVGLHDLVEFYNEFDATPVELPSDITSLGTDDSAEVTTIFVGPAANFEAQEVGTLGIAEVTRDWPHEDAPMLCPPPEEGKEYIHLQLRADTGPALQDYAFSGVEIRLFDGAGNQTGVGNTVLTSVCFAEFGAIDTAWKRGSAYTGGLLAQVTPETTNVAYSAVWGYGIDDTVYVWDIEDF